MKPEIEAVLASVRSLPPSDRAETLRALRSEEAMLLQEQLNALVSTAHTVSVDKRVAKYIALRNARADRNGEASTLDGRFKAALEAIEHSLLHDALEQGVTGFKTEAGTTYMDERWLASVADEKVFYEFVQETGELDFFERRIKATHVKQWVEAHGANPPGLNVFRENVMKVRKS